MASEPYLKSATFGLPDVTLTAFGLQCPHGQLQVGTEILCDGLDCPPYGTCVTAENFDLSGQPGPATGAVPDVLRDLSPIVATPEDEEKSRVRTVYLVAAIAAVLVLIGSATRR